MDHNSDACFIGEIDRTGYNELTSHQCTTVGVVGK